MKLSIMGCGYAGLVMGTCLANLGNQVICWDNKTEKIRNLKKGIVPIYEPGLCEKLLDGIQSQRLQFTSSIRDSVKKSDVIFIVVDTPVSEDGNFNLNLFLTTAGGIGKYANGYKVVVNSSVVPVGTGEEVRKIIKDEVKKRNIDVDFDIVINPELLSEGNAIHDFFHPERVVIGYDNERGGSIVKRIYEQVVESSKILSMSINSAEMIKFAANALLATKISFINDISNLCEILGPNIEEVKMGIGIDKGLGSSFYSPGIGYGGSTFARDIRVIVDEAKKHAYNMALLRAVEKVNARQKEELVKKISKYLAQFNQYIVDKTFAVWGLSNRPGTSDISEAPSVVIIKKILEQGGKVICYDPAAKNEVFKIFKDKVAYGTDKYSILENADVLLILTGWEEFINADLDIVYRSLKNKVIFDGRNIYSIEDMKKRGFDYISFGNEYIYNHSIYIAEAAVSNSGTCSDKHTV